MEDPSCSIFSFHETCEELKQKLLATTLELETMRNVKRELLNLLKMAYQERDEARENLQKLVQKLAQPMMMMMTNPLTKANSSITESNSPSQVSSPEAVEFSNMNNNNVVVESHNLGGYLNHTSVSRTCDVGNEVIEYLVKGKALPQKGKLLKAVMDAGPLLQTLLVAGPLPTWRNPPPFQTIKVPPLTVVQDFAASNNANTIFQKQPMLVASSHVDAVNNAFEFTSNATCKNLAPSRIPQSHHYFYQIN